MRGHQPIGLVVIVTVLALVPVPVQARVIRVGRSPGVDAFTITAALRQSVSGDTISLDPGVYSLANGEIFPIRIATNVSIAAASGPGTVIVRGNGVDLLMWVRDLRRKVEIKGIRFEHGGGRKWLSERVRRGGALRLEDSNVSIQDCVFANNSAHMALWGAGEGGAIAVERSSLAMTRCHFLENHATLGGALMARSSVVSLNQTQWVRNDAQTGGAFAVEATAVNGRLSTFAANRAVSAGAVALKFGTCLMDRCSFQGNECDLDGGGIDSDQSAFRLTGCAFLRNRSSGTGAALTASGQSGTLEGCVLHANDGVTTITVRDGHRHTLTNCVLSGNTTPTAVRIESASEANWRFCTMVLPDPDGIGMSVAGRGTLENCIVWGAVNGVVPDAAGAASIRYSDVQGGASGEGNIDADPRFEAAGSGKYRLMADSPCRDAGETTGDLPVIDMDGFPRVAGAAPDMGAFERTIPAPVRTLRVGRETSADYGTFSMAMLFAQPGDYVTLRPGQYSRDFGEVYPVTLYPGAIIGADLPGSPPILREDVSFEPILAASHATNVILDGLRFQAPGMVLTADDSGIALASCVIEGHPDIPGQAVAILTQRSDIVISGGGIRGREVGGLFLREGSLIAQDVEFSDCSSPVGGGAILASGTAIDLLRCGLRGCSTKQGGGALSLTEGSLFARQCWFEGNSGIGGALYLWTDGGANLESCHFTANHSLGHGGAILCQSADLTASDCQFDDNFSADSGGAISLFRNASVIDGCDFVSNRAEGGAGTIAVNSTVDSFLMRYSRVRGSTAKHGGALQIDPSAATIHDCVFQGNRPWGVVVNNEPGPVVDVRHSVVYGNGDGTFGGGVVANTLLRLTNCILWGNHGADYEVLGTPPAMTANLIGTSVPSGLGTILDDPLFFDAGRGDFHLAAGSPCIDRGVASDRPDPDFEGDPRPARGSGMPDIGVDERRHDYQPTPEPTQTPTPAPSTGPTPLWSPVQPINQPSGLPFAHRSAGRS